MSQVAWYRKYRSQNFDTVLGQQQVVETLRSAIASDHLSHAYLFTGPRGVGKTSVARLLARAANCTATDPAQRPCGTCDNCKVEIGSHLDLIEIDAASNRGIDDARALREKITSAPSMGRYKVYIIDEVHMLTTEAFNALLKTLEEPPAHAIFILATTEAHKLPETIVSRTQNFRFRAIGTKDMLAHLRYIADQEKVAIDDGALELIATTSQGSFRDAIGMLDQAANSGLAQLDAVALRQLLGHSDPELVQSIVGAIDESNAKGLLAAIDEAQAEAAQPAQLAQQLVGVYRARVRSAAAANQDDAGLGEAIWAIELLLPVLKSPWPQLALEAALLRLIKGQPELASKPRLTSTRSSKAQSISPTQTESNASPASSEAKKDDAQPAPSTGSAQYSDELWMKALTHIKQRNNSLYALLRSSCAVEFRENNEVVLACRFGFHRDRLKETKNKQVIEQALAKVYGTKFTVLPQLETRQASAAPAPTPAPEAELVASALEILGGEVVS
ncbi:DNA polymerase III subunit gamma/tau [Patescibacteria group bacterium]|nr:MAG: DNA polymerase III subunit gamma/tau [Patescibacteria group bacterium]